jgi:hypothetical protein
MVELCAGAPQTALSQVDCLTWTFSYSDLHLLGFCICVSSNHLTHVSALATSGMSDNLITTTALPSGRGSGFRVRLRSPLGLSISRSIFAVSFCHCNSGLREADTQILDIIQVLYSNKYRRCNFAHVFFASPRLSGSIGSSRQSYHLAL